MTGVDVIRVGRNAESRRATIGGRVYPPWIHRNDSTPKWARLCGLLVLCAAVLTACATPAPSGVATDDASLERLFRADPRWLGGDAVISVPLSPDRTLWLFGDSFVDPAPPYARAEAAFPRNTIAVQNGADPARATMAFHWRRDARGAPASFIPDDGADWFWPAGGVRLADGTLALVLHRIAPTKDAPPLGFATRGYAVLLVANPDDPPEAWRMTRLDGPTPPGGAMPGAALRQDGFVVALAVRSSDQAGGFVRFAEAALAQGRLDAEWWAGGDRGWLRADQLGAGGPRFTLSEAGAEASLHYDACARAFVHVASRGFGATDIALRTADALSGPWRAPTSTLRPPDSNAPNPFVYAGKAHPGVDTDDDDRTLTVTYVANSFTPDDLLTPQGETNLYWPRVAVLNAPACR